MANQWLPEELIIVDASDDATTKDLLLEYTVGFAPDCSLLWLRSETVGAASQRNEGIRASTRAFLWFFDDDITFEEECVARLWRAVQSDPELGGVSAMIVNQRYLPPGRVSRAMFTLMHGHSEASFAGKVIGPAINLLPEDREDLPEIVAVEWLNTTCTMYRREALPNPPFDAAFTGYSLMEDLTLSLKVAKRGWTLANVRTARVFHDSQSGNGSRESADFAEMEIVNRHYVMTEVLSRSRASDVATLLLWELFGLASQLRRLSGWRNLPWRLLGMWRGLRRILSRCGT